MLCMLSMGLSINITCHYCCDLKRITSLTHSKNVPSMRHCHHSQLIGDARKETSHIEECGICRSISQDYIIHFTSSIQVKGTDCIECDG